MKLICTIALYLFALALYANNENTQQQIQQRIESIGKVHVQGNSNATVAQNPTLIKNNAGKATYERFCFACHHNGLAGAPKFRNETDWQPRLSSKTLDGLVQSAMKGLNAMPAKGTCYSCSEEDIQLAIHYMISAHE